jgi:WD40-like Beta Propeller Repeat
MKWLTAVALCAGIAIPASPAKAKAPGPSGRIAFARFDAASGATVTYAVNPDGSHVQQLFSRPSEWPHWSPDGGQVSIFCCDDGMAAHIVDADTSSFRELAPSDPTVETHCGFWSPDGQRLACESFGLTDPSRTGIHTIRSSDGGGLTQITSIPFGDDIPGDFSPDGKRLVFIRTDPNGQQGIDVVKLNGTGLRQITPSGMILDGGFGRLVPNRNKEQDPICRPHRPRQPSRDLGRQRGRQRAAPASDRAFVRRSVLGSAVDCLFRPRLVAGRDEDRLHPRQRNRDAVEHLHREPGRERSLSSHARPRRRPTRLGAAPADVVMGRW